MGCAVAPAARLESETRPSLFSSGVNWEGRPGGIQKLLPLASWRNNRSNSKHLLKVWLRIGAVRVTICGTVTSFPTRSPILHHRDSDSHKPGHS